MQAEIFFRPGTSPTQEFEVAPFPAVLGQGQQKQRERCRLWSAWEAQTSIS